jgi:hypothetical protein
LRRREKYCHSGACPASTITMGLPAAEACRPQGVRDRHHGPVRGTNETASLQGKSSRVHDSPFGGSDGLAWLDCGHSTATTGTWPSPTRHRASRGGCRRGVRDAHHGPPSWPPGSGQFAGKKGLGVRDSRLLGSGMGSPGWLHGGPKKYCRKGGMPSAHPSRRRLARGSKMAIMAPRAVPRKRRLAGESPWVSVIHVLWCPGWTRLPSHPRTYFRTSRAGAATRCGKRPLSRALHLPLAPSRAPAQCPRSTFPSCSQTYPPVRRS